MTSVRAWACPKMFSRVVGFRRSAGLCHEIIHFYPWGKHTRTACFGAEVRRVPVKWRNGGFWETPTGSLSDRFFPEWCRILGLGGTGPASKSDWQVKKTPPRERKRLVYTFLPGICELSRCLKVSISAYLHDRTRASLGFPCLPKHPVFVWQTRQQPGR